MDQMHEYGVDGDGVMLAFVVPNLESSVGQWTIESRSK